MRRIVRVHLAVIAMLLSIGLGTGAQAPPGGEALLKEYVAHCADRASGDAMSERILALGLPATKANVDALRKLLTNVRAVRQRVNLIYLLGSMSTVDDATRQNAAIARDLQSEFGSQNIEIATAAALAIARLAWSDDRPALLARARDRRLIDDDTMERELAIMVVHASPAAQARVLAQLGSPKAVDILASTFSSGSARKRLSPEAKQRLIKLFSQNEPVFPLALGDYGYIDGLRYIYWFDALVSLQSDDNTARFAELALNRLNAPATDPRKIMAYLSAPESKRLVNALGNPALVAPLLRRIAEYSISLPQHDLMKRQVREATDNARQSEQR
jgi:hypothetical protein